MRERTTAASVEDVARIPPWLAWGILFLVLSLIMPVVRRRGELPVYTKAAARYLAGEQFYRPDDPPSFTYPPFCVLPFTVLVPLPDYPQAAVWWMVNLCLAGLSVREVRRLSRPAVLAAIDAGGPPEWIAMLGIGLLCVRYFVSPLEYQSNDLLVLFPFLLALRSLAQASERRRAPSGDDSAKLKSWGGTAWGAGVWGGIAAAYKATPLLLLPVLIWQRKFWAAALFVVTLLVASVLPDLGVRNPDQELWAATWYHRFVSKVSVAQAPDADGAWVRWNPLNQSLPGTIYRLCTPVKNEGIMINVAWVSWSPQTQAKLTLVLELAVLAAVAWGTWVPRGNKTRPSDKTHLVSADPPTRVECDAGLRTLGQGGCVLCGMLLLSPMSSTQHFVALIAPITFLVVSFVYRCRSVWLGCALLFILLLGTLGSQDIVGSAWADRLQAYGGSTASTLIVLAATVAMLEVERARDRYGNC